MADVSSQSEEGPCFGHWAWSSSGLASSLLSWCLPLRLPRRSAEESPTPSPHLAHIWRLLEESVCSLAWPSWPFYLFFINHPLPPSDPACPAPLNRLQFVSSEWCRALPARPGVAVLRLEGKEGPSPICSQAPLPADPRLCSVLLAVAQVVSLLNSHSAFIS